MMETAVNDPNIREVNGRLLHRYASGCPTCRQGLYIFIDETPTEPPRTSFVVPPGHDVLDVRAGGQSADGERKKRLAERNASIAHGRMCYSCRFMNVYSSLKFFPIVRPSTRTVISQEVARLRGQGSLIHRAMADQLARIALDPDQLGDSDVQADRLALEAERSQFLRRGDAIGRRMADVVGAMLDGYSIPGSGPGKFPTGEVRVSHMIRTISQIPERDIFALVDERHAMGDFGTIGRLRDAAITDDLLWRGDAAGDLFFNAMSIAAGFGLIVSNYKDIKHDGCGDSILRVATLIGHGTLVWMSREAGI